MDKIRIKGARQHNLKNVDLDIPKNKLVVFTGVSGSGKSSLAYDTIYAEGQRRYVESLSTYARQFLGIMDKPDVDVIEGLSPAISIDQKAASRNPRSTVGTVTEVYDYMRLLFARVGHPHCPVCGAEIASQTVDQIVNSVIELFEDVLKRKKNAKFVVLSPVVRDKKGEFSSLFSNLRAKGYSKVRIDGISKDLSDDFVLIKTNKHNIDVFIDSIAFSITDFKNKTFRKNLISRLNDSIEQSLKLSEGLVIISEVTDASFQMPEYPKSFKDHLYSEKFSCPVDNVQIAEIEPRTFSFNSPHGACEHCNGLGQVLQVDPNTIFSDEISVTEGGILPFKNMFEHETWYSRIVATVAEGVGIDIRTPIKNLNNKQKSLLLDGTGNKEYRVTGTNRFGRKTYIHEPFNGIVNELERRYKNTESDWVRTEIEKYMRERMCPKCHGKRLKKEALGITINKQSIAQTTDYNISDALVWVDNLLSESTLSLRERKIGDLILHEIKNRLTFLVSVGLEYLTLSRSSATLSSGEAQRIRLASQIGSGLTGVLYVLDEPTIGLHMRDNQKLIDTLKNLRDLGNSVLVVEHDEEMMKQSDHIVDFGPGAGKQGGSVVSFGTPSQIIKDSKSVTGKYLNGKKRVHVDAINGSTLSMLNFPQENGSNGDLSLTIGGCSLHNLNTIDVKFPLGKFIVLTGVSGSGKSSLLVETLYPALMQETNRLYRGVAGAHKTLSGVENIDKAILINQSPIGRTPRSNAATYTKMFDDIREVFASTRDARALGYKKGRFSFNLKGGRCEACEGQGQKKIEMQFMSDLWVSCEVCKGARYNAQTLEVHYKGKNISEVLGLTVTEALEFFHTNPKIMLKLDTLDAVGLGYMELGQPATTLSGGEAQRVKLSSELAKRATGRTVYILDEPTTGLHFADIEKLLRVLKLLVSRGNTVIVIEHNMDVIRHADWIIDLGPEGGEGGGELVVAGTVDQVKKNKKSYTGKYL